MFAGDVEVDEVLTNNDVGDTVTIVSDLKIQTKSQYFRDIQVKFFFSLDTYFDTLLLLLM